MNELSFNELRDANSRRNIAAFPSRDSWQISDWSNALAGETGEACNFVKKIKRDGWNVEHLTGLAKELADVVCYADLLASYCGIDLGEAIRAKFNEVSDRVKSEIKL